MLNRLSGYNSLGLVLISFSSLFGCSGGNSVSGEETTLVAQTYNEDCTLCHRLNSIADVTAVHSEEENSLEGEITGVTINGGTGTVTINFKLFDRDNNLIPITGVDAGMIRFTIAKLVPGTGGVSDWQSYINKLETKKAGDPGTTPDGTTAVQATYESASDSGGMFNDNEDGSYSYQMSFDTRNVTTPVAVTYESARTHRVAMQVSGNGSNAFLDFVPDGGALPATLDIVTNTSCNECHIKLGLHGGDRIQAEYCVTCHNPGTTDANSGNTMDFKVMIHKIHTGEDLPEVQAGGEYTIWGYGNSKHDYSTVVYPQDNRNCTKCHDGSDTATPDGDNWKNNPSTAACTSCHEAFDATEYPGFPNLTAIQIEQTHEISTQIAAVSFQYNIISVTNTNPGEFPVITFSVTNPNNGDSTYNILTDPAFTSRTGGASRLAILIGWDTTDYTNADSGSTPALPVSLNPLSIGSTLATENSDGTFSVTSPVSIPADVIGSGIVAIEGHPAGDIDGDGTYSDRIPVMNVFLNFPITDTVAQIRRAVVDIDKCNKCHGVLSLHGNNRTNEIQVCVICHNANATDINQRPANGVITTDSKVEETIDFKYMIHAIHAGEEDSHGFRENGIVVYGFGGSANDYSHVRLPAGNSNLKNCTGCHNSDTFAVPLNTSVLPTTILVESDSADPNDDKNITPTASACSSCHDSVFPKTHMSENGSVFDFVAFASETSSDDPEIDLCGPGSITSEPAGHSARVDCCSCHSVQ